VQPLFAGQQLFFRLSAVGVIYTTVDRANGSALWLFVKPYTFGTLVRYDVVEIIGYGFLLSIHIYLAAVFQLVFAGYAGPVGDCPFYTPFVNRVIGAFWFASPTIDAFVCYDDGHNYIFFQSNIKQTLWFVRGAKIRAGNYLCKSSPR